MSNILTPNGHYGHFRHNARRCACNEDPSEPYTCRIIISKRAFDSQHVWSFQWEGVSLLSNYATTVNLKICGVENPVHATDNGSHTPEKNDGVSVENSDDCYVCRAASILEDVKTVCILMHVRSCPFIRCANYIEFSIFIKRYVFY